MDRPNRSVRRRASPPVAIASSRIRSWRIAWAGMPSFLQIHQGPRRAGVGGGLVVDEQVRVGGGGPAAVAIVQPCGEFLLDQRGERDGSAVEVEPSIMQVGQVQAKDLSGAQAVEGEQRGKRSADGGV